MPIEKEYKILVNKSIFSQLLFSYPNCKVTNQTNYYFDTKDHLLRNNHLMLRIRVKNNSNELTIKIPKDNLTNIEINQEIDDLTFTDGIPNLIINKEQQNFSSKKNGIVFHHEEILKVLNDLNINENELICTGFLMTKRWQKFDENGVLCFDENKYLNTIDYEIEYELNNESSDSKTFFDLIKNFNLNYTKNSSSKYKRLLDKNASLREALEESK